MRETEASPAFPFLCKACGERLSVYGEANPIVLVTAFPAMLGSCFVNLTCGPSILPCERCGELTELPVPQAVFAPDDGCGVLYLPDDRIPANAERDQRVLACLTQLPGYSVDTFTVARDCPNFRRAFLQKFVEPHTALLNAFTMWDGS